MGVELIFLYVTNIKTTLTMLCCRVLKENETEKRNLYKSQHLCVKDNLPSITLFSKVFRFFFYFLLSCKKCIEKSWHINFEKNNKRILHIRLRGGGKHYFTAIFLQYSTQVHVHLQKKKSEELMQVTMQMQMQMQVQMQMQMQTYWWTACDWH